MSDTMDDLLDCRERLRKVENDRDLKAELADRYAEDVDGAEARAGQLEEVLREIASTFWGDAATEAEWMRNCARRALSSEDATRPTGDKE